MKERVLVTGASGFIGANLVRRLLRDGCEVHAFVREGERAWRLEGLGVELAAHHVDLRDRAAVERAAQKIRPVIVYHLATHGGYPKQSDIQTIVETNILGSLNLFRALETVPELARLVNAGTSSEYGLKREPMRETDLLEPTIPYGVAKAAQTLFAQYFAREHRLPAVTLRFLSVFGPFEEPGRLVSDIMVALAKEKPLALSSPLPTRDFIFVEDVVDAIIAAAHTPGVAGEIINIGGGKEYSVGEVLERAMAISSRRVPITWGSQEKRRAYDAQRWVSDPAKAKHMLQWQALHSLDEGLLATYRWFEKNAHFYES